MKTPKLLLAVPFILLAACQTTTQPKVTRLIPMDAHSYADPNRVRVTNVALDLQLDFEARVARGTATLDFERRDLAAPLVLDTKDLELHAVRGANGQERRFDLGPADPNLGSALTILLEPGDAQVIIDYATTAGVEAMQWLDASQTADGALPFLFTQGQSILTRSWIPLQDSPGVRITYSAKIMAPQGMTPVMSAEQLGQRADGRWIFRMPQAIPPYLIALACGRLEFRAISDRAGIWAEPSMADRARKEFEDTEAMIVAAEELFGPYRWGRYDILILPPAFPFGGMENPRLTFATPTVLAGDKSLVALIAHELAHSWSGNLVTNATWSDFWLNEGTTTYFEQRIMEAVYGDERSNMEKLLEYQDLERELAELAPRDQILHIDLAGRHPDDGFSGVPYVKGALLVRRLENLVGRQAFDRFLRRYFDEHAFRSITTADFESYLRANLLARRPGWEKELDLTHWLYAPGLPADAPKPVSRELQRVADALQRFDPARPKADLETDGWVTQQWLFFLEGLPQPLGAQAMTGLDQKYSFTNSGNSEILAVWLRLSIQNGYAGADQRLEQFLMTVGRRKFLKPLYTELAKTEQGKLRGRAIYANARLRYHTVSTGTIDKILDW